MPRTARRSQAVLYIKDYKAAEEKMKKIEESSANPAVFAKSPYLHAFGSYNAHELSNFHFLTSTLRFFFFGAGKLTSKANPRTIEGFVNNSSPKQ